jgi:hypothetical protein
MLDIFDGAREWGRVVCASLRGAVFATVGYLSSAARYHVLVAIPTTTRTLGEYESACSIEDDLVSGVI